MSKRLFVPQETTDKQAIAADPGNSAWVAANAGSGKTHVLSRRVIRLLLDGVDPSRILCLTYTRAAAANMVNKVFDDLGRWAVMEEAELVEAIADLEGHKPSADRLALARQLFARALETPGGLKIQTIHAFCEAVLHQFPLEANIAGHFELIDAQMELALLAEARRQLFAGASGEDHPELSRAFELVLSTAGEHGLNELLSEIVRQRDGLRAFVSRISGSGDQLELLKEEFGLGPEETTESIAASIWPDHVFTPGFIIEFGSQAETADARNAIKFAEKFAAAARVPDTAERLDALCGAFLRADKSAPLDAGRIAAKGLQNRFGSFVDDFSRYAAQLLAARDRLAMLQAVIATDAALTVADNLIARYERLKSARGFLDFNDLISRTVNLLAREDAGAWVQYKLDRGLDHILVDEAQDTSPGQWSVITRLATEFFSGQSARSDVNRTIFAVGDEKQSIYSFQGAEPAAFAESGREFASRVEAAQSRFTEVRLQYSFRSVGDVLSAVDRVFEPESAREGLTLFPEAISHSPVRANDPGYVEIWPMIGAEKVPEPEDWTVSIDHASQPAVMLAEAIAGRIHRWIKSGEVIEGSGKVMSAGDVMVLVRKRDSFVHALSRALKVRQVPVAGADRLRLRDHIAVKDLAALGRFCIQEHDDLSLAALLKSPVFNLSEDDLFSIAHDRGSGVSLWQSLKSAASKEARYGDAVEQLAKWRNEAGLRPAVEFYSAILGRDGVRAAMIARLGHEAGEILDEFVNFVLSCEQAGITGLGSFLETLETAGPEIKREVAQARDEVRIMTVHAAKGLEAPVVFLIDNGSDPFSASHLPRLMKFPLQNLDVQGYGYLWRAGAKFQTAFGRDLEAIERKKAEEEYRRLLYVGMTRAEDRLLVCGYHGVRDPKETTWHRLVSDVLLPASEPVAQHDLPIEGELHRFRSTDLPPRPPDEKTSPQSADATPFPDALRRPLPPEISLPRPFSPSGAAALVDPKPEMTNTSLSPVLSDDTQPGHAIERGIAIHRLLQSLPDMAGERREAAAAQYLQRHGATWQHHQRQSVLNSVMQILADPRFADVFAAGSQAEVALAGHLVVAGNARAVSGKIDRLAVNDDEVLIVDYKTNRVPPRDVDEVPPGYVAQIAVYSALIRQIYPDRKVTAGLLFTETPQMLVIPESVMQEALERLAVS